MNPNSYSVKLYYKVAPEALIDCVCHLYIDVFSAPPRYEVIDFNSLKENIKKYLSYGYIYTLSDNDLLVGVIGVTSIEMLKDWDQLGLPSGVLYLDNVMLNSKYRGLGLGKFMLSEFCQRHKDECVYTRCRTDAKEILRLFELFNFKSILEYEVEFNKSLSNRYILKFQNSETIFDSKSQVSES